MTTTDGDGTSRAPRRRRLLIAVLAAAAVVATVAVVYGPAFYRDVIVGEQPPPPTIATPAAAGTDGPDEAAGGTAGDLAGAWSVGSGSYAGYRLDEVLRGTDVTVVGRTEQVTGELTVDDATLATALVTVDVASISTDSSNRDDYFRGTALRTDAYPTATFELTEPVELSGGAGTVSATGDLTIAGETQTVSAELEVAFDGDEVQVAGAVPIAFADFGIEAPDLGFVSVEPTGFVELHLFLERT